MLIRVIPMIIWMYSNYTSNYKTTQNYENRAHKYSNVYFFAVFVYYKLHFNLSQRYELIYRFYHVKLLNLVAIKFLAVVLEALVGVSTLTP